MYDILFAHHCILIVYRYFDDYIYMYRYAIDHDNRSSLSTLLGTTRYEEPLLQLPFFRLKADFNCSITNVLALFTLVCILMFPLSSDSI